jgi:hypothetical protein
MSLLATFVVNHLLPALESALEAHEPELQESLLKELEGLSSHIVAWIESKTKTS